VLLIIIMLFNVYMRNINYLNKQRKHTNRTHKSVEKEMDVPGLHEVDARLRFSRGMFSFKRSTGLDFFPWQFPFTKSMQRELTT